MNSGILLAANIVLMPFGDYLGEIPAAEVCEFSFKRSTVLAPGTRITVDPYTETYGEGSVIQRADGMICSNCAVPRIEIGKDGKTIIYCEVRGKYE